MTKQRGTFQEPANKKVGIVLPVELADFFIEQVGGKTSGPATEAILIWLALADEKYAQVRDRARTAAKYAPKQGIKMVEEKIAEYISNGLIQEYLMSLSPAERGKVMVEMKKAGK